MNVHHSFKDEQRNILYQQFNRLAPLIDWWNVLKTCDCFWDFNQVQLKPVRGGFLKLNASYNFTACESSWLALHRIVWSTLHCIIWIVWLTPPAGDPPSMYYWLVWPALHTMVQPAYHIVWIVTSLHPVWPALHIMVQPAYHIVWIVTSLHPVWRAMHCIGAKMDATASCLKAHFIVGGKTRISSRLLNSVYATSERRTAMHWRASKSQFFSSNHLEFDFWICLFLQRKEGVLKAPFVRPGEKWPLSQKTYLELCRHLLGGDNAKDKALQITQKNGLL